HPRWLLHHRVPVSLQVLAWAGLVQFQARLPEGPAHDAISMATVAMVAVWVTTGSFDRVATAWFATLASLPALMHVWGHDIWTSGVATGAALLVAGMMVLALQRGHHGFQSSVRRRLERETAARQARLLEQLLQNTEQGIWFLDNQGMTTDLNNAMARLLGRRREEVLGRSVFDYFAGEELAVLHHQLELRKQGRKEGYEIGIVRADGSRIDCFNNATPIYDEAGQKVGSVGMWTDLTLLKRALAEVERGREELFALLDAFPGFVTSIDRKGRFVFINERMAQWYGHPARALLGRPVAEVATAVSWGEIQAWMDRIDAGEILVDEREYRPSHLGRQAYWMQSTRTGGLPRPDGTRNYYSFGIDTTDRVKREAERQAHAQQMQTLLSSFPGGIASIDHEGRYLYVNQIMADILRRPAEQVVGRMVEDVLPQRAPRLRQELLLLQQGQVLVEEVARTSPDGGPDAYFQATRVASPPDAQGRHTYYAFTVDITERRRAEARAVGARGEAERTNPAQSQFMSQMSHELRTPLNAVLGFGQLLQDDPQHPLAPKQLLHVQEILKGGEHLLNLINGLLDISRIESGKFAVQLGPVPVTDLVNEALKLMQPVAGRAGISMPAALDAPADLHLRADRTRLMQVLLTLLSHAIKYNRERGSVSVEWLCEQGEVTLGVRDTGPGLTREQRQQLFEPFQRLHAEGTRIEGTGIGLALSRRLIEAMGGAIGVDSEPGRGCLFWVRMPHAEPAAADPTRPAPLDADHADDGLLTPARDVLPCTVLYIEDNPVNLLVMQAMIARIPRLEMISADDGAPGLGLALRARPDLILTDIQMPGMDGFELLRQLRAHEATRAIPVVAISADAMPDTVARGQAAGFAEYLTKPVQMDALHEVVQRLLRR
ncbi:MAG: PAS domain S-box protein, partial [Rubrivivax sp.]